MQPNSPITEPTVGGLFQNLFPFTDDSIPAERLSYNGDYLTSATAAVSHQKWTDSPSLLSSTNAPLSPIVWNVTTGNSSYALSSTALFGGGSGDMAGSADNWTTVGPAGTGATDEEEMMAAMETIPYASSVVLIILYTLTTIAAVCGNSLAIVVFARGRRSNTDLRPFLINLAAADLIMAIFCIPFTFAYQITGNWIFSEVMCPIVQCCQVVSVAASVSTNTSIGIDRLVAVKFPFRKRVTSSYTRIVILAIWVFAGSLGVVPLVMGRTREVQGKLQCEEQWSSHQYKVAYGFFIMIATYFLPVTILTATYTIIGRHLWRHKLPGNADDHRDAAQLKSKRKVVKMLATIVLLFGVCWLPLHGFIIIITFNMSAFGDAANEIYFGVHWLSMANSFVNPVVYGFMNENFRADLETLLASCCGCQRRCGRRPLKYRAAAVKRRLGDGHVHDATTYTLTRMYEPDGSKRGDVTGDWQGSGKSKGGNGRAYISPDLNTGRLYMFQGHAAGHGGRGGGVWSSRGDGETVRANGREDKSEMRGNGVASHQELTPFVMKDNGFCTGHADSCGVSPGSTMVSTRENGLKRPRRETIENPAPGNVGLIQTDFAKEEFRANHLGTAGLELGKRTSPDSGRGTNSPPSGGKGSYKKNGGADDELGHIADGPENHLGCSSKQASPTDVSQLGGEYHRMPGQYTFYDKRYPGVKGRWRVDGDFHPRAVRACHTKATVEHDSKSARESQRRLLSDSDTHV